MFKIIAVVGVLAGAGGYAAYEYNLFGCKDEGGCPLSKKPCCSPEPEPVAVAPASFPEPVDCCAGMACCESKPTRGAACCSAKTTVATKVAVCCADPSIASALVAGEVCAAIAIATASDTVSAKAAVAGMAAFVPAK
jgi:hypothetical protein